MPKNVRGVREGRTHRKRIRHQIKRILHTDLETAAKLPPVIKFRHRKKKGKPKTGE